MGDLFRPEAVSHYSSRLTGSVMLRSSIASRWIAAGLIGIVVTVLLLASLASYARKETVSGWLIPPAGLIRQSAQNGGVIQALHVQEGEVVKAGQPIATVRLSQTLAAGDSYNLLAEAYRAQRSASEDHAAAAREMLDAERLALERQRSALAQELGEARRRVSLQRERLRLAQAEVSRAEPIAEKGFLPGSELEARRSAALQADQTLSEMTATSLSLERQIAEVVARLRSIPIDVRTAQAEARSAEAGIDQQLTQAQSQSTYVVTASVAGRVAALPAALGQAMNAGGVVAILTPVDAALEAELYVPSRAAGFVRSGQEVRLMYQAFPFQKFGAGDAHVVSVSRTVLAPAEVQMPGSTIDEPVFRVRAKLSRTSVAAYGDSFPLQPGMLLNADIIIERRSLIEWLLDPLYAAGRRT